MQQNMLMIYRSLFIRRVAPAILLLEFTQSISFLYFVVRFRLFVESRARSLGRLAIRVQSFIHLSSIVLCPFMQFYFRNVSFYIFVTFIFLQNLPCSILDLYFIFCVFYQLFDRFWLSLLLFFKDLVLAEKSCCFCFLFLLFLTTAFFFLSWKPCFSRKRNLEHSVFIARRIKKILCPIL